MLFRSRNEIWGPHLSVHPHAHLETGLQKGGRESYTNSPESQALPLHPAELSHLAAALPCFHVKEEQLGPPWHDGGACEPMGDTESSSMVHEPQLLKPACQCGGHGFEPWSGRIPHATEQLGP